MGDVDVDANDDDDDGADAAGDNEKDHKDEVMMPHHIDWTGRHIVFACALVR